MGAQPGTPRRALLASVLGESTVTELADHLGFTQPGRLAGTYGYIFGEAPSATLARPYRGEALRLWVTPPARTATQTKSAQVPIDQALGINPSPRGDSSVSRIQ